MEGEEVHRFCECEIMKGTDPPACMKYTYKLHYKPSVISDLIKHSSSVGYLESGNLALNKHSHQVHNFTNLIISICLLGFPIINMTKLDHIEIQVLFI